ncbi:MAG: hypothetical protein BWY68_00062 [bacterium ADurb.Bin400]|nr:MAG: hypothetical protein BWY68_00062 [bacterium ADurb.Bin400]
MLDELVRISSIKVPLEGIETMSDHAFMSMLGNCEMEIAAQALLAFSKNAGEWVGVPRKRLVNDSEDGSIEHGIWGLEYYGWIMVIAAHNQEYILPTRDLAEKIYERQTGQKVPVDPMAEALAMEL